jgi:hypothetical protein
LLLYNFHCAKKEDFKWSKDVFSDVGIVDVISVFHVNWRGNSKLKLFARFVTKKVLST